MTRQEFKAHRRQLEMTHLDLANKLGCTANAVRKWEYGHMVISKIVQKAIMGMVKG